eukprot:CAMPEP_0203634686 /NCGR_PEP_ID=MMETSP0088-20131115/1586_1 /ASSEMBLY_ACC=CAM_ASM_001087 /TAXON_ID=426623 /ORGANISM="Chaetoceros affinis, Strain CCMP159" /LENGTH=196 /DNA_ID=CAMNT_0050488347 /DNA_START=163 /DNA_END=753 /DNA_ORIENTATION=+
MSTYKPSFQSGDRVTLHGVKVPGMNGLQGNLSHFLVDEDRWEVDMDEGYALKVFARNLSFEMKTGDRVALHGLNSKQMNGRIGTVANYFPEQSRWEVELDEDEVTVKVLRKNLKHIHERQIRFFEGDRVILRNLKMKELNGKTGNITQYIADEGRWEVELDEDEEYEGGGDLVKVSPNKLEHENYITKMRYSSILQ